MNFKTVGRQFSQHDGNISYEIYDEMDDYENGYCWTQSSDGLSPNTYSTESSDNSVATEMSAFDRAKRGEMGRKINSIKGRIKLPRSSSSRSLSGNSKLSNVKNCDKKPSSKHSKTTDSVVNFAQIKDIWIETCDFHPGNLINVNHTLPPPCNLCKAGDGHGQKGRAFRVPKLYEVFGNDVQMKTAEEMKAIKQEVWIEETGIDAKATGAVSKLTLMDRVKAVFHTA